MNKSAYQLLSCLALIVVLLASCQPRTSLGMHEAEAQLPGETPQVATAVVDRCFAGLEKEPQKEVLITRMSTRNTQPGFPRPLAALVVSYLREAEQPFVESPLEREKRLRSRPRLCLGGPEGLVYAP
jgi:hypothetical protein